jgi:hypothetical protein
MRYTAFYEAKNTQMVQRVLKNAVNTRVRVSGVLNSLVGTSGFGGLVGFMNE